MRRFVFESSECFTSLVPKDARESGDHRAIILFPARWVLWQQGLLSAHHANTQKDIQLWFVVERSGSFTSLIPKDARESGDHSTIFYFPARWVLWQQGLLITEGTLLSGFTSKLWKSIQSSAHEEKRWGGLSSRAVSASQAWYQKMRENLEITEP